MQAVQGVADRRQAKLVQLFIFEGDCMNQNSEPDHIQTEIKESQRKDMLLCINKILAVLDTENPAGLPWKAAHSHIQLIEGKNIGCTGGCFNPGCKESNEAASLRCM